MASSPSYVRRPFHNPPDEFPRDQNGLVDLEAYNGYLVDDPDDAPIEMTADLKNTWMYQHLYFQRIFYSQQNISRYMKDRVLVNFRNAPYNQLAMRRAQELQVHLAFEEHVSPPPPETMHKALIDFKYLDALGATALGRRISMVPEALEYIVPGGEPYHKSYLGSPSETVEFFDNELKKIIEILKDPIVTPQRVITGVIRRTGRLLNNETLLEEAQSRISLDPIYYPVRLRGFGYYFGMSRDLLNGNEVLRPLQTGVDEVKLAA